MNTQENEHLLYLSPGITCHLVCRFLPKQKQVDREVKRDYMTVTSKRSN